ncbi:proprotein convertase P-domain-containing protein [Marinicella meishanensis]|uniref:proprotein convertase P-domain-containing protein n=1 Tax=Marinicella meishanensis TaxID=2873263 RepID=UPI001CBD9B13|nr:proprotein convertase P-domain-containing protein [Marinicella sp. NBU2979]
MKLKTMICIGTCLSFSLATAQQKPGDTDAPYVPLTPQTKQAVKFDVSLPLSMYAPKPITNVKNRGGLTIDPGPANDSDAPFPGDPVLQSMLGGLPGPTKQTDFLALDNISGVSPPDPAGDVGPNHYVAMTNLSFAVLDKSGNTLFGPAANNTLWSGFGGDCESDNAGDPIVLYDQISDRWLLSQFTSSAGPQFYNCIAISQTSDPTGAYYRWAILNNNGSADLFPDYPKYGVWSDGFYISTRDFNGGSYAGVGVYALNRDDLIAGVPNPRIVYFFIDRSVDPWQVGDGLLPADIDGDTLPPPGSPQYFVGSMDNGGPYSAAADALSFWEFVADYDTPANSTFTRTALIPIAEYDTQFSLCSGRNCIPQAGTSNGVDIQSYRQRPLHRLAYRNFGTHESLVTNQSVEASAGIGGIRWWEIRDPDTGPTLFQEGTYGPGTTDNIHRWMGSIAMDRDGNMGLAYSASGTAINPAIRFTGRLQGDALGAMDRTEGSIIEGTGSQTSGQRWGDYTSTNIDPVDDCTFWHVNEYYDTNGGDWQIRVGSFKFDVCGDPGFFLAATDPSVAICQGDDATYDLTVGSVGGYDGVVTLSQTGEPAGSTVGYSVNPVPSLPGASTVTVSNTGAVAAGNYMIDVLGTSPTVSDQNVMLSLDVADAVPTANTLIAPADGAVDVDNQPSLSWDDTGAVDYLVEIATDAGFTNIVFSDTTAGTTLVPSVTLGAQTEYFWRVTGNNSCGASTPSATFSFTTVNQLCFAIGLPITDNNPPGDDFVGSVVDTGTLDSLTVSVDTAHTWVGDLILTLSKDGTSVVLMDRPGFTGTGFGCGNDDIDALFDDGSGTPVESECEATPPAIGGTVQPEEALAAFNGVDLAGDWTLNISDNAGFDTGTLNEFCLLPVLEQVLCDPAPPVGDPDVIWFNGFQCVEPAP